MTDEIKVQRERMKDVLFAKVPNDLYRKVYKVSAETGFSMSEVIRLCVEMSLPVVGENLARVRKIKYAK